MLFVRSVQAVRSSERTYAVCSQLMDTLPTEYLPTNAQEIDYIFELKYDHEIEGTYRGGYGEFYGLEEFGTVTLYEIDGYDINYQDERGPGLSEYTTEKPETIGEFAYITAGAPKFGSIVWEYLCEYVR